MEKLTVVRKQEKEKAPFACLKVSVTSANNGRQKTKKKKKRVVSNTISSRRRIKGIYTKWLWQN